jgi:hypothetical protein
MIKVHGYLLQVQMGKVVDGCGVVPAMQVTLQHKIIYFKR